MYHHVGILNIPFDKIMECVYRALKSAVFIGWLDPENPPLESNSVLLAIMQPEL